MTLKPIYKEAKASFVLVLHEQNIIIDIILMYLMYPNNSCLMGYLLLSCVIISELGLVYLSYIINDAPLFLTWYQRFGNVWNRTIAP